MAPGGRGEIIPPSFFSKRSLTVSAVVEVLEPEAESEVAVLETLQLFLALAIVKLP